MKADMTFRQWAGCVLLFLSASQNVFAQATPPAAPVPGPALFATVNGTPITQADFHAAFSNYLRQKFYHGQVPQEQVMQARKEVEDQVINRILFLEEIQRRGISADTAEVDKQIATYDQRYASNPNWQKSREGLLPGLREQLSQQNRLAKLEQAARDVAPPSTGEVKAFFDAKPELFTEPEKQRLRMILLTVDPSAPREAWSAATREAESIVRRIRAGADFAEQARLSSNDASAESGGDLGYLHRGMLPEAVQEKVDGFKIGEIADPVETLQGIAILKLEERVPPMLQPFDKVSDRARDLLHRERKDKAWKDLVEKLRADAKVVMFAPAAASVPASAAR